MNNEWKDGLPPVGAECESLPYFHRCAIVCQYQGDLLVHDKHDDTFYKAGNTKFRPIKSEAEKRREKMEGLMFHDLYRHSIMVADDCNVVAKDLINEGWIKPKPLTDDEIRQAAIDAGLWGDRPYALFVFAKAIEAYVRGDSATGE